jgi:hypothetical protein
VIYLSLRASIKSGIPVKKPKKPNPPLEACKKAWQEFVSSFSNFTSEVKACLER